MLTRAFRRQISAVSHRRQHLLLKFDPKRFMPARKERPAMLCACCGAVMVIVRTRIRATSSAVVAVVPRIGVAI